MFSCLRLLSFYEYVLLYLPTCIMRSVPARYVKKKKEINCPKRSTASRFIFLFSIVSRIRITLIGLALRCRDVPHPTR